MSDEETVAFVGEAFMQCHQKSQNWHLWDYNNDAQNSQNETASTAS
jgi:hypothetical protein